MKPQVQLRLGRRVSAIRNAHGYTQEQLAERCSFTVKFISSIERGLVNVPLATLAAIARALGVSISELTLGVDGSPPRELRSLEQLFAGRSRKEQAAVAKLLTSIAEMLATVKDDSEDPKAS
jgi:transcriptional regulator with XRE-family HTH domain